jgi:hypothetical protein
MANEVRTVFIADITQFEQALERFQRRIEEVSNKTRPTNIEKRLSGQLEQGIDRAIAAAAKRARVSYDEMAARVAAASKTATASVDDFGSAINRAAAKAHELRQNLRDTTTIASRSDLRVWQSYATGANAAAVQARNLFVRLKDIHALASRTTDARMLSSLREQARTVEAQIDRLDTKMRRVAAGRADAAVRAPGRIDGGALLGAAGALGVPGAAQATAGVEAAALLGVSTAALATLAAAAAAIAAAKVGSEYIRDQAEKRLRIEEGIAAAMNKQALTTREIGANLEKQLQMAASDRQFSRFLGSSSISDLERRFTDIKRLQDLSPNTQRGPNGEPVESEQSIQRRKELLAIEEQIAKLRERSTTSADQAFAQRFENWKKAQADAAEAAKRFAESVKAGEEKVKELGQVYRRTFEDIARRANADNPFVQVFMDADESLRRLRENLRGLPKELQDLATRAQQAISSRQLFEARLENAMQVFDLREVVQRFRDDTPDRRNFAQNRLDREIEEFERRRSLGVIMNDEAQQESFRRRQRLIEQRFPTDSPSARLDRLLESMDRIRPEDSSQQAILDMRVVRSASAIDPSQIRGDQRERIAAAAERSAEREERRFREALDVQKQMLRFSESIDANQKRLLAIAERGGIQGVEAAITIRDETAAGVDVLRRGSPGDVAARYDLTQRGPGGLSNF